ncbi:MAG: hypothetical protein ACK40C_01270 [Novosphingobium meiothermophilum]
MSNSLVSAMPVAKSAGTERLHIGACALLALSAVLSGCGGKETDPKIEARLAAVEAKAASADRRAREAVNAVRQGNPAAVANFGPDTGFGDEQDANPYVDPGNGGFEGGSEVPESPAIGQ